MRLLYAIWREIMREMHVRKNGIVCVPGAVVPESGEPGVV